MYLSAVRVFFPDIVIFPHINAFESVKCHNIEIADRFVILRRIACRDNDPSGGHVMTAKRFALQKLQHSRRERFRNAVDFINKQNALLQAGFFDFIVHRCDNLAHGVLGDCHFFSAVLALGQIGETDGALAGVMRDGIRNQADAACAGSLLHDSGFADARRAHEQNRALMHGRNQILSVLILCQICLDGSDNFLFCTQNIHNILASCQIRFT